jgi:hypothetical protein
MLSKHRLSRAPEFHQENGSQRAGRLVAEIAVVSIGGVLLIGALLANQRWLDRHFVPSFFLPRLWYVRLETLVRVAMATLGVVSIVLVRPRVGRLVARAPALSLSIAIAALLAMAASELVLQRVHLQPAEWLLPDEEPRRRPDPQLGWTFVPSRTGHASVGGREIDYAFDAAGYRVRQVDAPVDVTRPTILFIGESVMFGEGLAWEESIPAQVESMIGIQSANLAVHGFGTDQAYLRLQRELPHFKQPTAVVTLFMSSLFGRNLDEDRPHLGPGLTWLSGSAGHSRLTSIAKLVVPYRSDETIERGVLVTRDVLRAIASLTRSRGATPLILVPQFGAETPVEHKLRQRVLDDGGFSYVWVEINAAWRLPWDRHPNPQAARALAAAVAAHLRE